MTSELAYLREGLLVGGQLRDDLTEPARALAHAWVAAGVEPAVVEILAETLARWAKELDAETVTGQDIVGVAAEFAAPDALVELLGVAGSRPLGATEVAALAVHLVDIAEAMAARVFVPELPALSARSDRTGDAARMVGVARHLKG